MTPSGILYDEYLKEGEQIATMKKHIRVGDTLAKRELLTIQTGRVQIPHSTLLTHLQFRRFAGCPICNLHLRTMATRHQEIVNAGICEVVVFQSSEETMLTNQADLPFAMIADPRQTLAAAFGIESGLRSILHPGLLGKGIRGALDRMRLQPRHRSMPKKGEGALVIPADFLIAPDGHVLARKYGEHADDQWSVDELLSLARENDRRPRRNLFVRNRGADTITSGFDL